MSAHPNVLLIAVLTPDDSSRKTMRAILEEAKADEDDYISLPGGKGSRSVATDGNVELSLHFKVMEETYDDDYQITAKEGDLLFFDLVTYGYGEYLKWDVLEAQKQMLDEWCKGICERHRCTYEIRVSANYW